MQDRRWMTGVYLMMALVSAFLLLVYSWIAPGATQSSMTGVLFAFLVGQAFLIAKLTVRLSLMGGQLALFRSLAGPPEPAVSPHPPASAPAAPGL